MDMSDMSSQLGNAAQLITSVELVSLAMSGALDIHHALQLCSIPVLLATSVSSHPPPPPGASHWNQLAMQL